MKCKSCKRSIIFLRTKTDRFIPVDFSSLSEDDMLRLVNREEVLFDNSRHITHFATCPQAKMFRKHKV